MWREMHEQPRALSDTLAPAVDEALAPFVTVLPLQMLAYHAAIKKGVDVDRPRHLVKSVRE